MIIIKKIGKILYDIYLTIGAIAMGLLAVSVIFTVIARYCFSYSWKSVSEFNVTLFAFTTFWGMGLCILKNEHVVIDILYNRLSPNFKKIFSVINYIIVFIVDLIFMYFSFLYTKRVGIQISQGMEILMYYIYGIMPICALITGFCIIIKLIQCIKTPTSEFAEKENSEIITEELM